MTHVIEQATGLPTEWLSWSRDRLTDGYSVHPANREDLVSYALWCAGPDARALDEARDTAVPGDPDDEVELERLHEELRRSLDQLRDDLEVLDCDEVDEVVHEAMDAIWG